MVPTKALEKVGSFENQRLTLSFVQHLCRLRTIKYKICFKKRIYSKIFKEL